VANGAAQEPRNQRADEGQENNRLDHSGGS
jgi:hypothetical protein